MHRRCCPRAFGTTVRPRLGRHGSALTLLFLVGLVGCSRSLEEQECEALLDHYTERLLKDEHPSATQVQVAEKQAAARQLVRQDPVYEFEECSTRVSRSQFECAMAATSVDHIEQCLVL